MAQADPTPDALSEPRPSAIRILTMIAGTSCNSGQSQFGYFVRLINFGVFEYFSSLNDLGRLSQTSVLGRKPL